jgi:hypothetical protein
MNLAAYQELTRAAVTHFWSARTDAAARQQRRGETDQGNRAGVTAGKNMDGFVAMIRKIIVDNGMPDAEVFTDGRDLLTVPGYFRPTKNWDLLVVSKSELVCAIEVKSQVGPSFGNNFNNRVEEALGNATDLLTAFREGAFGERPKPFVGYLFVLEDCDKSRSPTRITSPHFKAFRDFEDASYAKRYEIFCRRLVLEQLYDSAAIVLTKKADEASGAFTEMSEDTSCLRFVSSLAARIVATVGEREARRP